MANQIVGYLATALACSLVVIVAQSFALRDYYRSVNRLTEAVRGLNKRGEP